jgi:hypothetical protein
MNSTPVIARAGTNILDRPLAKTRSPSKH